MDIDFAAMENLRRLYEHWGQEEDFKAYLEKERGERLIKLSKLSKRFTLDESLTRLIGFCVVQIHLTYNLPSIFDAEVFRTQWESS